MANIQGYKAVVKVGANTLHTRGPITIAKAKNRIDITCHGDAALPARTFMLGLQDPIEITLPVIYDSTDTALSTLLGLYDSGNSTAVTFESESGTTLYEANFLVPNVRYTSDMNDAQVVEVTLLQTGAATTDNL